MQGELNRIDGKNLAVIKGFNIGVGTKPGLQYRLTFRGTQIGMTAPSCMIGMGVGNDSTLRGLPGINIKVTFAAV